MSDTSPSTTPPETPSTWMSILTGVIVFVLLAVCVVIIVYLIKQGQLNLYPVSPFNYGDTIAIRPALLSANQAGPQYLTAGGDPSFNYGFLSGPDACTIPPAGGAGIRMGAGARALQFTGTGNDDQSKWVLERYSAQPDPGNSKVFYDANNGLTYGFGNRFYLRNKNNTNDKDLAGRVRYQLYNEADYGLCYNMTPAVIGSSDINCNWFETELIVYFLPTIYPDIYWILFPTCQPNPNNPPKLPDTTRENNNGIVSYRPWAPWNSGNTACDNIGAFNTCVNCQYNSTCSTQTFNPFLSPFPPNSYQLYPNVMLMNNIASLPISTTEGLPPLSEASNFLFKITKA